MLLLLDDEVAIVKSTDGAAAPSAIDDDWV